eukprot:scaffold20608_cov140-Isochrysis_galbana.AAC.1
MSRPLRAGARTSFCMAFGAVAARPSRRTAASAGRTYAAKPSRVVHVSARAPSRPGGSGIGGPGSSGFT